MRKQGSERLVNEFYRKKRSIIEFLQLYCFSIAESTNIYIIPPYSHTSYNLSHEFRFFFYQYFHCHPVSLLISITMIHNRILVLFQSGNSKTIKDLIYYALRFF
jgi:hypothetical protein